ncbi:MAG: hypothetical protein ACREYC_25820, partial [Gammaproteobacteria bacterium]
PRSSKPQLVCSSRDCTLGFRLPICPMGWTSHAARLSPDLDRRGLSTSRDSGALTVHLGVPDAPWGYGAHGIAEQGHPHPRRRGSPSALASTATGKEVQGLPSRVLRDLGVLADVPVSARQEMR